MAKNNVISNQLTNYFNPIQSTSQQNDILHSQPPASSNPASSTSTTNSSTNQLRSIAFTSDSYIQYDPAAPPNTIFTTSLATTTFYSPASSSAITTTSPLRITTPPEQSPTIANTTISSLCHQINTTSSQQQSAFLSSNTNAIISTPTSTATYSATSPQTQFTTDQQQIIPISSIAIMQAPPAHVQFQANPIPPLHVPIQSTLNQVSYPTTPALFSYTSPCPSTAASTFAHQYQPSASALDRSPISPLSNDSKKQKSEADISFIETKLDSLANTIGASLSHLTSICSDNQRQMSNLVVQAEKHNRQIELLTAKANENDEAIAALKFTQDEQQEKTQTLATSTNIMQRAITDLQAQVQFLSKKS